MVYNGIIQSAQPIISYNYGAGLMRRGRDAFRMALGSAFACGLAYSGSHGCSAPWIVGLFLTPDAPAYAIAVRGLPLFAAGYPFFGIKRRHDRLLPEHRAGTACDGAHRASGHRADGFLLPRAAAAGGRRGDLARGTGGRTGRNAAPARTAAHRLRDEAVNGEREHPGPHLNRCRPGLPFHAPNPCRRQAPAPVVRTAPRANNRNIRITPGGISHEFGGQHPELRMEGTWRNRRSK